MDSIIAKCVVCKKNLSNEPTVEVISRMKKLCEVSEIKQDGLFSKSMASVVLHVNCRKSYTRRAQAPANLTHSTRSFDFDRFINVFDFKTMCLFCSMKCVKDERHPDLSRNVNMVTKNDMQQKKS